MTRARKTVMNQPLTPMFPHMSHSSDGIRGCPHPTNARSPDSLACFFCVRALPLTNTYVTRCRCPSDILPESEARTVKPAAGAIRTVSLPCQREEPICDY